MSKEEKEREKNPKSRTSAGRGRDAKKNEKTRNPAALSSPAAPPQNARAATTKAETRMVKRKRAGGESGAAGRGSE